MVLCLTYLMPTSQAHFFHPTSTSWGLEPYHLSHRHPISHPLVALGHHHHPLSPQQPIQDIPTQLSHVTYLWAQAWRFLTLIAILATPNIENEIIMDNRQGAHALPAPNVRLRAKRAT